MIRYLNQIALIINKNYKFIELQLLAIVAIDFISYVIMIFMMIIVYRCDVLR